MRDTPIEQMRKPLERAAILTPALLVVEERVARNVDRTIDLLHRDPTRWRPHVKTAKLGWTMRLLLERGVRQFKCATTKELRVLAELGAPDVLAALPFVGPSVERVCSLAAQHTGTRIAALVDDPRYVAAWRNSRVSLFLDLDVGLHRTGIAITDVDRVLATARAVRDAGLELRGLHAYEADVVSPRGGGLTGLLDRVAAVATRLAADGFSVEEVVTSGTPTFAAALDHAGLSAGPFAHRVSPGTLVYGDLRSLEGGLQRLGYEPAALVLARVVSRPAPDLVTCDAGHKAIAVDAGIPGCAVVGWPQLTPCPPSEEHLPLRVAPDAAAPEIGDLLVLAPRHVCPTVNLFDHALLWTRDGIECSAVTARGHEPGSG